MINTLPSLKLLKSDHINENTTIHTESINIKTQNFNRDRITNCNTLSIMDTETVNKEGKYSQTIFDFE